MKHRLFIIGIVFFMLIPFSLAEEQSFFKRLVTIEDNPNGICEESENLYFNQDCTLNIDSIFRFEFLNYMWFLRLIIILAFMFYFFKPEWFPVMVVLVLILMVLNGAFGYEQVEIAKVDKLSCEKMDFFVNLGGCIWPSSPMIGWGIVITLGLLIIYTFGKDKIRIKPKSI